MKLKRILAGVLAASAVLTFAGCNGNKTSTPANTSTPASSSAATPASTPASSSAASTPSNDSAASTPASDTSTPAASDGGEATGGDIVFDESKIPTGLELEVCTNRTDLKQNGYLEEMVKPFEEKYGCKIIFTAYTNYSDVKTRMTTDDYGDVLNIPGGTKPADLARLFEPLGTVDDLKGRYNWVESANNFEGNCYGLGTGGSVDGGICVNYRVWREAGIDLTDPANVPKTPEDFIADLKKIRETVTYKDANGNDVPVQPFQTCYGISGDKWVLTQIQDWAVSITGDPEYKTKVLTEKRDLFDPEGGHYKAMKFMYDVFKEMDLHEGGTGLWEDTKPALNSGHIACMFMKSWAVSQFQKGLPSDDTPVADDFVSHPEDIGFIPLPFMAADGKLHAQSSQDTCMGVNSHTSDEKKELGKAFIWWWINESPYVVDEKYISTLKGGELPDIYKAFGDTVMFSEAKTPEGLNGVWDEIDNESEVGTAVADNANYKCRIAEAAFGGQDESVFEEILAEMNEKWAETRDENEKYNEYMASLG